jgi:hypothetical protein
MGKVASTWMGFLAMAFAVVGLTGLFATFAAPLPLQRALARDQALDELLAGSAGPDLAATFERLRPRLAESGDALSPPGGDMAARIASERRAMHARFIAEADAAANRLRWLICIATVMAAVFGMAVLHIGSRQSDAPKRS